LTRSSLEFGRLGIMLVALRPIVALRSIVLLFTLHAWLSNATNVCPNRHNASSFSPMEVDDDASDGTGTCAANVSYVTMPDSDLGDMLAQHLRNLDIDVASTPSQPARQRHLRSPTGRMSARAVTNSDTTSANVTGSGGLNATQPLAPKREDRFAKYEHPTEFPAQHPQSPTSRSRSSI